jgi:hypothetical protein
MPPLPEEAPVYAESFFRRPSLGSERQVSFTIENKRLPNYSDWMKHRVDGPQGKEIYSHRMSVVEPVFGNIGTTKRLNRFSLRGKKKV